MVTKDNNMADSTNRDEENEDIFLLISLKKTIIER